MRKKAIAVIMMTIIAAVLIVIAVSIGMWLVQTLPTLVIQITQHSRTEPCNTTSSAILITVSTAPLTIPTTPPTMSVEPPHRHNYTFNITAPSCENEGFTTYVCDCGYDYVDDRVAALGHSWGEWVASEEATETVSGEERRECAACGKNYVDSHTSALGQPHRHVNL